MTFKRSRCSVPCPFFQAPLWVDGFELIYVPVLPLFVHIWPLREATPALSEAPAPVLKPNPMSSHSACSSREFCMTCAAPSDKGRMGCGCPHGEAGAGGGRWGGGGVRVLQGGGGGMGVRRGEGTY